MTKSEQSEEAAARWFMRQQSGSWTDADQACLDAWLDADTAHRIQYLRVQYAWAQSGRMKALGAGVSPGVIPPRGDWGDRRFCRGASAEADCPSDQEHRSTDFAVVGAAVPAPKVPVGVASRKPRLKLQLFAAAAPLILAGVIYVLYAGLLAGTRYSTPIGSIKNVTIADGSRITLNTDTRIRVVFSEHERRIGLERGEAFFEVAKDGNRPFVVYVGHKRVMAVGTKFSVRRHDDDVQVVVTEGRVKLATAPVSTPEAAGQLAERVPESAARRPGRERSKESAIATVAFLDAGAIAQTSDSEVLVRPDAADEAERLLSWRVGYVSFDNVPLAQAVAEFNRYNDTQIIIDDPAIASVLVGGNFRSNNTEAFLDLLQSGFPIAVERRDGKVILTPR